MFCVTERNTVKFRAKSLHALGNLDGTKSGDRELLIAFKINPQTGIIMLSPVDSATVAVCRSCPINSNSAAPFYLIGSTSDGATRHAKNRDMREPNSTAHF